MGLTQNLGRLSPSIFSDSSLNIGVGAAPSGSYKFEITGTSKVSGVLTLGATLSNGTYTYTLPAATGTLALVGGAGVGTVTSVAALTLGTTGTDLSSTVATSTTTPVITLNVPTASAANRGALSSADWTTFNSKQSTITLTTTGTSGAATFSSNTLNIPNYAPDLSGYVTLATTQTISGAKTFTASIAANVGMTIGSSGTNDITWGTAGGIKLSRTNVGPEYALSQRWTGTLAYIDIASSTQWNGGVTILPNGGGNVLIGTNTFYNGSFSGSASGLNINAAVPISLLRESSSGNTFYMGLSSNAFVGTSAAISMVFITSDAERMRITSGGNVGIGTTSPSAKLYVLSNSTTQANYYAEVATASYTGSVITSLSYTASGTGWNHFIGYSDIGSTTNIKIIGNGNIQNANNSYGAISDIKLKENIIYASPKLNDLLKVKIRSYNLIGSKTKQIGVIAQEIEQIFPAMIEETIDIDKDGNDLGTTTKSVKYSVFVPMLIKAVQELKAEIDALKNN